MNQRLLSISNESMDYEVQTLNHLNLKVIFFIIESVESETYVFHQGSNHVEALSTTFSRKKWDFSLEKAGEICRSDVGFFRGMVIGS